MKTYKAMYRCRLCGKAFYNGMKADQRKAAAHLIDLTAAGRCAIDPAAPKALLAHECGKPFYGMGLADFIGWDAEEVDE